MTDAEAIDALAMLVTLHAIAEAADAAKKVSDDLWRAELLGPPVDPLPTSQTLIYEGTE